MGAVPGPLSHKVVHMDEAAQGAVWVSNGLTVPSIFALVPVVVACHITILVFRLEGVYIPVIGLHPGILSS